MNRFLSLLAFAVLLITQPGCTPEKNLDTTDPKVTNTAAAIVGTWELSKTTGAMNPQPSLYPAGNGNLLKFTASGYEMYQNGVLVKTGTYAIIKDLTVSESVCLVFDAGRFTDRIVYDGDYNAQKVFLEMTNKKINFISGCYAYDAGHTMEYTKQ